VRLTVARSVHIQQDAQPRRIRFSRDFHVERQAIFADAISGCRKDVERIVRKATTGPTAYDGGTYDQYLRANRRSHEPDVQILAN
jgi:hypothetical protein